jgi:hypothetical protein
MFLDYLLCAPLSHRSFEIFTERVLPRLPSTPGAGPGQGSRVGSG